MTGSPKDIADVRDGHPERFVPQLMSGRFIDAEHRARYWWATALVTGKNVLDAACGTGYGTNILAGAGASAVVGVDRAAHVIEFARAQAQEFATFQVADLLDLPFADRTFDVVICFEAIEHVDAPERALDELRRVLEPDGVLALSSPNRGVSLGGNPHHHHEFTPDEFESVLRARFEHVRLARQHRWVATAILDDEAFESCAGRPLEGSVVHKVAPAEVGRETYTLALASNAPVAVPANRIALTESRDRDVLGWYYARIRNRLHDLAHKHKPRRLH
jgi:SAM-dependent methyltransferase